MSAACCSLCGRDRMRDPSAGGCACVWVTFDEALERAHAEVDRRHRTRVILDGLLAAAGLGAFLLVLLAAWAWFGAR